MRRVRLRRIRPFLLLWALTDLTTGCATYGFQRRSETAATLGVVKEELKTPDTVRQEKGR